MDEIFLETLAEAEAVVAAMRDLLDQYGYVTVGDSWYILGVNPTFEQQKIGWDNLDSIEITEKNGKFSFVYPPTKVLTND